MIFSSMSPVLEIAELRKSYGELVALDGVDVEVRPGEIVALLGPNGAGKTTLISIVAGLRRADSGTVRVGDVDALADPGAARRLIGLAPQDLGLYPVVSARQNLALFGEIAGLRGKELRNRIDEVADILGLTHLLDRRAGTLSGGEKRRLHSAMALIHRPPLLLLDEATTGADVQTRARLLDVVRRLAAEGSGILYSTHYMPEVEMLDAKVMILEGGKVIASGELSGLISAHGLSAVELSFEGPPPDSIIERAHSEDGMVRIPTQDPGRTIAETMAVLGTEAGRLRSVQVVQPSLESVYLALTGHRYEGDDAPS